VQFRRAEVSKPRRALQRNCLAGSAALRRVTGDVNGTEEHRTRQRSVEALYRRYFSVIREKCRRMLSDRQEAEDVAQETFTRLWLRGPADQLPEAALPWIYATSTRLAVDRLRRRRRARRADLGQPDAHVAVDAPDQVIATRQVLERLARTLSEKELALAILLRLDGLTQPDAARALGTSERTIRRLVTRLDARIAALIQEEHP
jgi:RNA polymerase sigma-70 factor, ECF subfamily